MNNGKPNNSVGIIEVYFRNNLVTFRQFRGFKRKISAYNELKSLYGKSFYHPLTEVKIKLND